MAPNKTTSAKRRTTVQERNGREDDRSCAGRSGSAALIYEQHVCAHAQRNYNLTSIISRIAAIKHKTASLFHTRSSLPKQHIHYSTHSPVRFACDLIRRSIVGQKKTQRTNLKRFMSWLEEAGYQHESKASATLATTAIRNRQQRGISICDLDVALYCCCLYFVFVPLTRSVIYWPTSIDIIEQFWLKSGQPATITTLTTTGEVKFQMPQN